MGLPRRKKPNNVENQREVCGGIFKWDFLNQFLSLFFRSLNNMSDDIDIRIIIVILPILIALSWALINILGILIQQLRRLAAKNAK